MRSQSLPLSAVVPLGFEVGLCKYLKKIVPELVMTFATNLPPRIRLTDPSDNGSADACRERT